MENEALQKFSIFFSWTNDNPGKSSIVSALKEAIDRLNSEKYAGLTYEYRDASRDLPGSSDIIKAIKERLRECDCALFDQTILYRKGFSHKGSPNPNVMFEYGYAHAVLGAERCILLRDDAYEKKNLGQPFDMSVNQYFNINSRNKEKLVNDLETFIKNVVDVKAFRPKQVSDRFHSDKMTAIQLIDDYHIESLYPVIDHVIDARRMTLDEQNLIFGLLDHLNKPWIYFYDDSLEKHRLKLKTDLNSLEEICNDYFSGIGVCAGISKVYDEHGIPDDERYYREIDEYRHAAIAVGNDIAELRTAIKDVLMI